MKYEKGKKTGLRGKPGRLAGIAVIVAVAVGALAFVLTQSSSAQTASKAAGSSSASNDGTSSLASAQPSTQQMSPVETMTRWQLREHFGDRFRCHVVSLYARQAQHAHLHRQLCRGLAP